MTHTTTAGTLSQERARSAQEARRLAHTDLRMPDVARYDAPAADTIYPLEYAYYLLPNIVGKHVLDYGCGDGLNTVGLLRRGAYVVALDISADLLRVAKQRALTNVGKTGVWFYCADAHATRLSAAWFDVVFGTAILHHLDLDRALTEVYRLLKPGGVAIFKEPMRSSAVLRAIRRLIPYTTPETSPDEYPLRASDWDAAIRRAGFTLEQSKDFLLPTTNVIEAFLPRFARWSYRLDAWLLRYVPFLRFYASQRVVRLRKGA